MANLVTRGLAKIEIGAIAVDGGMGTSLAVIGYTAENSVTFSEEDGTTTEFYAEEIDTAIDSVTKAGKRSVNFTLASPDPDQLVAVFGGTTSGTAPNKTWKAPDSIPVIEKSLKITPSKGLVFSFPKVSLAAKFSGGFSKTDTLKVDVIATVLQPDKAGEAKASATPVA